MIELTQPQIERFRADGFLVLDRLIDPADAARVAARFERLFRGEFETGLYPDEWNWREGRDKPDLARQICNGWKADYTVASLVLRAEIGRLCAQLAGWPGARLAQDNIIWKPPGARPLGFHQDDSYNGWIDPPHMLTCWIGLDPTTAAGGTIEYVRGSHIWPVSPPIRQFHAPADYRRELMEAAAAVGLTPEIVPVEVPAGGCAFHDGGTWHGSDTNRADRPRRSAVAHCMSSAARFHPTKVSYIYNRYKRVGDTAMDESFFPILWTRAGERTAFLDDYMQRGSAAAANRAAE
ncbi:MAG TPA: phytanoyl-CoA dioxygenase family protein [Methylomirabilota bacterium]|nr:phytanoyl-CoA dioxygenase family protein [Methylomirabilota bacterium]